MCLVIYKKCPCGNTDQRGATLPCEKAFVEDNKGRNREHRRMLLETHLNRCEDCWTWRESDKDRGLPMPDCNHRLFALQDGMYQVFCSNVIKIQKEKYCCEDCCGRRCKIAPRLQRTTADSEKSAIAQNDIAVAEVFEASPVQEAGSSCQIL